MRTRDTRTAVVVSFFVAMAQAATTPFQSLLGIEVFGLSSLAYSSLTITMSCVGLILTVCLGILSDRFSLHRLPIAVSVVVSIASALLFSLLPSTVTFCVLIASGVPFLNTAYSSVVGEIRRSSESSANPELASSIGVASRSVVSIVWVFVPSFAGVLATEGQEHRVWFVAAVALMASLLVTLRVGASERAVAKGGRVPFGIVRDVREPPSLRMSIGQLGWRRIIGICCLAAPHRLAGIILPLLVVDLGGSPTQVGLVSGIMSAIEVPSTVVLALLVRKRPPAMILVLGSVLFTCYLIGVTISTELWLVFALLPIGSMAATIIVAMPVTYVQDQLRSRAGLAVGVVSAVSFGANALAMASFAVSDSVGIRVVGCIAPVAFLLVGLFLMKTAAQPHRDPTSGGGRWGW
jgi:SET family sugar efflux transporter-like MFS transporter